MRATAPSHHPKRKVVLICAYVECRYNRYFQYSRESSPIVRHCKQFIFNRGRRTCWEPSIKMAMKKNNTLMNF